MSISTRGRYAVRMMLDLAEHDEGEPVRLKDMARRQEISEKYLEQIAAALKKAGFIRSVRGAQGGYILQRKPGEYTVGEILRLTEGSLAPVECVDEPGKPCPRAEGCAARRLWAEVYGAVNRVVDGVTLEELMGDF